MLGLTGREFVLPLLMRADAFAHARVPPPPRAHPMNDLLPGLRAALAREEATSATRSTAEVELAATGSTPSSSAKPTRAERFMDDASAAADSIDALRDDLDVIKALDTRRDAPRTSLASSHPPTTLVVATHPPRFSRPS